MMRSFLLPFLAAAPLSLAAATLFEMDFEKETPGSVPESFLVLDGGFAVKEVEGNKLLELPGAPLDTFGVLFGPAGKENMRVSARVFGSAKGRRFPVFDVGLNGVGGYKLRVSPAKKQLELYRGDAVKKAVPLDWEPGQWTRLELQVVKSGEAEWTIAGQVWQGDTAAPPKAAIRHTDTEAPSSGRASVSGMPYSGTPVWFDDLRVESVGK